MQLRSACVLASLLVGCAGEAPVDHDFVRDARADVTDGGEDDAAVDDAELEDTGTVPEDTGEVDAADDAGGDAATDGSTDAPLACDGSEKEPNNSLPSAVSLAGIDDCDGSGSKLSGVVAGGSDVDFWHFEGKDSFGCVVDPTVSSSAPSVRVCVFATCGSGPTEFKKCSKGTVATLAGGGVQGCCSDGPGEASLDYTCTLPGTGDDADVYVRVDSPGASACLPYEVSYHF